MGKGLEAGLGLILVVTALAIALGQDRIMETALFIASPAWLTDLKTRPRTDAVLAFEGLPAGLAPKAVSPGGAPGPVPLEEPTRIVDRAGALSFNRALDAQWLDRGSAASAAAASGGSAIQSGRAAARCAGDGPPDRAARTAVQAAPSEPATMGTEPAPATNLDNGGIDAQPGTSHGQRLGLADDKQGCGRSQNKTGELHVGSLM